MTVRATTNHPTPTFHPVERYDVTAPYGTLVRAYVYISADCVVLVANNYKTKIKVDDEKRW